MLRREALNNHNTAKKNGYFLGHSDNLITLSLSGANLQSYIIKKRGQTRVKLIYGFSCNSAREAALFFVPRQGNRQVFK